MALTVDLEAEIDAWRLRPPPKRYPGSKWVDLVRGEHLKRVEEQLAAGVPESRGRKKR